ncbi:MAG: hypothetical protein II336_14975 [Loktanella sp.]|nr:hypothetical protein [Loktanella sp.]
MVDKSDAAFPYVVHANKKEAERRAQSRRAINPLVHIGVALLAVAAAWMHLTATEPHWITTVFFSLVALVNFWQAFLTLFLKRT